MGSLIQRSFTGGELTPSAYARVDTVKYAYGAKTMRNNIIMRHGGTASRPGDEWVCEVKDSTKRVRLIKFVFNSDQTYLLEFGDQYMRVVREGVQLTNTSQNITGVTNANPGVVTYAGSDTFANGNQVLIGGVAGGLGEYLNGRVFKVAGVNTGTNTFQLNYLDGTAVNTTSWGAYSSGGTLSEIYEIATPYLEADLPSLQYVQSGDVITIVHPSYAPRELTRSGHTTWTLEVITFEPETERPAGAAATAGAAGSNTYRYRATAINDETGEESLPAMGTEKAAGNLGVGTPQVIRTTSAHGFSTGDEVIVGADGVESPTTIHGRNFTITVIDSDEFSIQDATTGADIDGSTFTDVTNIAAVQRTSAVASSAAAPTATAPNVILVDLVAGCSQYNVYKESSGTYGFIGTTTKTTGLHATFNDIGYTADTSDTPPTERNPFDAAGDYPSTVNYVQQRRFFANTNNNPETGYMSRTGHFYNFTKSEPIQDDDTITFTLAGKQVNAIKHLIDIGTPVVLTQNGEFTLEGDGGILTPSAVNPRQFTYNGCGTLSPIVIGGNALYVQARNSIVRDLGYQWESQNGYKGNDLSIFSAHLFDGYTIVDWDYQQIPHSIVWAVRSDGILLGLTYVPEQQINGWHRHDFGNDTVENVCVIPEGTEDAVYFVVKRTINGATKRYIERLSSRMVTEDTIKDYIGMDAAITYDGRHSGSTTMTLSGGTTWAYDETITITASASTFTSSDVGNEIHLTGTAGDVIRFELTAYTSGTVMSGRPHKTVPASMRSVAIATWARAVDRLTGAWHLEGMDVSIFADGFVVASPNNESYEVVTVANGVIELDRCYAYVHVGLPYLCDLETLNIDTPQGETISDKNMQVNAVTLICEKSRGAWVGCEPPSDDDDDPLEGLTEVKIREDETQDEPVALTTENMEVNVRGRWNSNGRIFIRQVDPIPLSVLAVVPSGSFPIRGGG
jgi:hypothetical protein